MSREEIDAYLDQLRAIRKNVLADLDDVTPDEFRIIIDMERWNILRRALLQIGNHLREHANQINDTRSALDLQPSMAQRMLAEAELAYGVLLAALVGLEDADLDAKPADGEWSIRQVLEHIVDVEQLYLDKVNAGRARSESDPTAR